jgi:uncharacterized protein (TIGR03066 family)
MSGSFVRGKRLRQGLVLAVLCSLLGGCSASNQAGSPQQLLVGRWKMTEGFPKGATYEFTKDGKMTYTHPDGWGWTKSYHVEGNHIVYEDTETGRLERIRLIILKLTDDTLVVSLGTNIDIHGNKSEMSTTFSRVGR